MSIYPILIKNNEYTVSKGIAISETLGVPRGYGIGQLSSTFTYGCSIVPTNL